MVEAAGGVVWRDGHGGVEVLLVHRPVREDWSFPKGKLDPGEDHVTAALREVEEEAAVRCHVHDELPETRYTDRFGRPKRVRYWSMQVDEDLGFEPNDEVDERRWVTVAEAHRILSYDPDRVVLAALRASD